MGLPAGSKRRTVYEAPHPRDTGPRTSSARCEPTSCVGVAFGVAASGDSALAPWLDGAGALGLGRAVALSLGRPPLAPWSVPAFSGAPVSLAGVRAPGGGGLVSLGGGLVSLDVMLGSRDAVPVTSEGPLVSRCLGVSRSASRGDTDFVLAGPPAEGDSLFGRAGGGVSVRAGRVSATTGFSVTAGNCARVKLSLVWPGAWSGPPESGPVKS